MKNEKKFIGLDVHKETISVAVFGTKGNDPEAEKDIVNDRVKIKKLFSQWNPKDLKVCYEAGPTGFALYRQLKGLGIDVQVIAPGRIHRAPADRIKTDRRDARMLGRMLRNDMLTAIYVPTEENESVRDFMRARDDLRNDLRRSKQRLLQFLLRKGHKYSQKAWTQTFIKWLNAVEWKEPMELKTFQCYLHKVQSQQADMKDMDIKIQEISLLAPYADRVRRLRCFRGIDTLTAMYLVTEIGDFRRFPTAQSFMSFLGMVPGEYSSGASRHQTGITKTGSGNLRRILTESAWSCRFVGPGGDDLRERRKNQPPELIKYVERAQKRLTNKYQKMLSRRKSIQITITAVGRELAGFVWGAMVEKTA